MADADQSPRLTTLTLSLAAGRNAASNSTPAVGYNRLPFISFALSHAPHQRTVSHGPLTATKHASITTRFHRSRTRRSPPTCTRARTRCPLFMLRGRRAYLEPSSTVRINSATVLAAGTAARRALAHAHRHEDGGIRRCWSQFCTSTATFAKEVDGTQHHLCHLRCCALC